MVHRRSHAALVVGSGIGLLPGLGAAIASFASYGLTRRLSKNPDSFGKGNIKGIAAAESADNAVIPSSLITLFALGIPGSVIAAILAAGFTMHGIIPGPLMMRENPEFMLGLFGSMLLASVLMLLIGWIGMRLFARVITIPFTFLFSGVIFFSVVGAYLQGGGVFGVYVMVVFGIVGYFLKRFDFSFVTFIIGFIIGPQLELAVRQSLIIVQGTSVWDYPGRHLLRHHHARRDPPRVLVDIQADHRPDTVGGAGFMTIASDFKDIAADGRRSCGFPTGSRTCYLVFRKSILGMR